MTVNYQRIFPIDVNLAIKPALRRIIFDQIGQIIGRYQIVNGYNFDIRTELSTVNNRPKN
jgi:hypothetical protein